jgi:hypothetical protein
MPVQKTTFNVVDCVLYVCPRDCDCVPCSVVDLYPDDPYVFGPPGSGSGSVRQRYGSGSGSSSKNSKKNLVARPVQTTTFDFVDCVFHVIVIVFHVTVIVFHGTRTGK